MPTASEPRADVHYAGPADEWVELMRERDELRVENVRLRARLAEFETARVTDNRTTETPR